MLILTIFEEILSVLHHNLFLFFPNSKEKGWGIGKKSQDMIVATIAIVLPKLRCGTATAICTALHCVQTQTALSSALHS